ncbi:MAG: hypothetical protein ACH344_11095 [Yersinia sp. (in: enterobacteria)]
MTTSISLAQHIPEALYGGKMPVTNDHKVSGQPMPLENMALPTLSQSHDDPYVFAQQVLANSGHRLASSEAELYALGGGQLKVDRYTCGCARGSGSLSPVAAGR